MAKKYDLSDRAGMHKASLRRLADAKALLRMNEKQHGRGAMYLAGYAVECKLKATAMERFGCTDMYELMDRRQLDERDVFQHGLASLLDKFGMKKALLNSEVAKDFVACVNRWSPQWRYQHREREEGLHPEQFVESAERIVKWLGNNPGA
jgi:hypothetical protein